MGRVGINTNTWGNETDAIQQHRPIHSILSCTHTTHTPLSLRPVDCYLVSFLGVCPNSAVVVPEEFPRGRFG